jgi:cytochrome c oxidase subunit I+III
MPVYAWAVLIFGVMIILAFPAMIMVTFLLETRARVQLAAVRRHTRAATRCCTSTCSGSFGHPDVYIIFIPASAMVSTMIVPTVAQALRLVGHEIVVLGADRHRLHQLRCLGMHHMFTVGPAQGCRPATSRPRQMGGGRFRPGAQVFAWIATLAAGKVQRNVPSLFLVGGILIFVMGGLTGVMVGMVAFDGQAHDTYFVVAHLHYVLIGSMVFPLFAGFYYWAPFYNGHRLPERSARWPSG